MNLVNVLAATAAKSSNSTILLFGLLIIFGGIYLLVLRPRQKRAQQAARVGKTFEIGDEVVTIGGVCGTVISINDDKVILATGYMEGDSSTSAPLTHMTFLRQAIARKVEPTVDETNETATSNPAELTNGEENDDSDNKDGSSS